MRHPRTLDRPTLSALLAHNPWHPALDEHAARRRARIGAKARAASRIVARAKVGTYKVK